MRMGSELPKQFLLIGGKPILMHTLEVFHACKPGLQIILVLPHDQQSYWEELCRKHHFQIPHRVVDGGDTRFASVKNGLAEVTVPGLVGVHDGVRPFVAPEVIRRCYELAAVRHAVIPVTALSESLRHVEGESSRSVFRDEYRLVQTPQVFDAELLKRAYDVPYSNLFTDDASVVEAFGERVYLTEGNRENVKITTPFDLLVAESFLKSCSI